MVDTHAHIYSEKFAPDSDEMLERAFQSGVERIYMPNIDVDSILPMLALADKYPGKCIPMIGLHPCYVGENYKENLAEIKKWLNKREFVAIGEMGTDLYWDKTHLDWQQEAFRIQCEWALEIGLPIVIHCRESFWETVALVKEFLPSSLTGVFHCFSGGVEEAQAVVDLGFKMGIGGVVTYKNGGLDQVLPHFGLEHIVLETDCPYLAPIPYRGKRNEPSFLSAIATKISEIKGVSLEHVVLSTTKNANDLFKAE